MLIAADDNFLFDVCMHDDTATPYYNSKINFHYLRSYIKRTAMLWKNYSSFLFLPFPNN